MFTQIENESLPAHVSICSERYKNLDERIRNIETKVDYLNSTISKAKSEFNRVMITTGGSIVVAIIGAVSLIKFG